MGEGIARRGGPVTGPDAPTFASTRDLAEDDPRRPYAEFARRYQGDIEAAFPGYREANARAGLAVARDTTVVLLGPASRMAPALRALGMADQLAAGLDAERAGLPLHLFLPAGLARRAVGVCGCPLPAPTFTASGPPGLLRVVVLRPEGVGLLGFTLPPDA